MNLEITFQQGGSRDFEYKVARNSDVQNRNLVSPKILVKVVSKNRGQNPI